MFMESIIYLQNVSMDYFDVIQNKIDQIGDIVLEVKKNLILFMYKKNYSITIFF